MAFTFKHPTKYTKNNTDKIMPGSGDLSEKEKLISLAMSETAAEEQELSDLMDMKYGLALEKYLENNPGKTEKDFKDMVIRIPLEGGGSATNTHLGIQYGMTVAFDPETGSTKNKKNFF